MFDWEFRDPWFLLLLLLAPLVFRWARRPQATIQYSSLTLLDTTPASWRTRLAVLPPLLLSLAIVSLVIGLARPRTPDAQTRVSREGIAIMMIVDRSSSMNARDLVRDDMSVDRLTVVKEVFRRFVLGDAGRTSRGRPDDMIGLVTFAGYADSICPLTTDHANLTELAEQLEIVSARGEDGTSLGDGLGLAVERLRQSDVQSKIAILLTDGVQNAGVIAPRQAAELAAQQQIKVYCIGAGTTGVAPMPMRDPFSGRVVLRAAAVEIDEQTLTEIAELTGGKYFRATDVEALADIYRQIDQLERTTVEEVRFLQYTEHFSGFVLAGFSLVSAASIFAVTLFRNLP